jgi:hypothetical protein
MIPPMQILEIVSPYANPLCIVTFQGVKFKSPSFEMFIYFSQINVVIIIKLSPFKIIIIKNSCTIHLNPQICRKISMLHDFMNILVYNHPLRHDVQMAFFFHWIS